MGCSFSKYTLKSVQAQQQSDFLGTAGSKDPAVRRLTSMLKNSKTSPNELRAVYLGILPEILSSSISSPGAKAELVQVVVRRVAASRQMQERLMLGADARIDEATAHELVKLYPYVKELDISMVPTYMSKTVWMILIQGLIKSFAPLSCCVQKLRFQVHPQLFPTEDYDEARQVVQAILDQTPCLSHFQLSGSKNPAHDQRVLHLMSLLNFPPTVESTMLFNFELPNGDELNTFLFQEGNRPDDVSLSGISLNSAWKKPRNLNNQSTIKSLSIHRLEEKSEDEPLSGSGGEGGLPIGHITIDSTRNGRTRRSRYRNSNNGNDTQSSSKQFLAEVANMPNLRNVVIGNTFQDDPESLTPFFRNILKNNTVQTVSAKHLPVFGDRVNDDDDRTIQSLASTNTALKRVSWAGQPYKPDPIDVPAGDDGSVSIVSRSSTIMTSASRYSSTSTTLKSLCHCAALNTIGRNMAKNPQTTLPDFVHVLIKIKRELQWKEYHQIKRKRAQQYSSAYRRKSKAYATTSDDNEVLDMQSLMFDLLRANPGLWCEPPTQTMFLSSQSSLPTNVALPEEARLPSPRRRSAATPPPPSASMVKSSSTSTRSLPARIMSSLPRIPQRIEVEC